MPLGQITSPHANGLIVKDLSKAEALEVLRDRAGVGLNLHFRSAALPGARQAVVLFCHGEEPLDLPHPLRELLPERLCVMRVESLKP